ncbi:DUF2254 domain-containing protein [Mycobacterium sp. IDR2000157661]|uniref:DUF2254 domain-containing protein n=1 Tax=Mycobacterium sp. IDR2000157661 TaxID=2867005 RepID=UPI001EE9C560|nr:DUF2254 domain-containing protein [Mycobacterium sp. IDR2000157661]ULE32003.1 DUF2254 domain-containing protein [Mycobacterium sp. IDR2000157661]
MASKNRWSRVREGFRTQLWPVPLIGVLLAITLGVVMPSIDVALADVLPAALTSYLFGGGPSQASEMLSTIAGSLITVTSLTFSLTVVTLQLASAQYSPRLLRTFARDRFVQLTLALFLSTFAYALVVLRTVRLSGNGSESFVPRVSVTLAYLLALASVIGLVLFLAHLVREIRVETMMTTVRADASVATAQVFKEMDDADASRQIPSIPAHAALIHARADGFLAGLDQQGLLSAAEEQDAVVVIDRMAGDWVVKDTPVAYAWSTDPGVRFDEDELGKLADQVTAAIHTADERTPVQDVAYGLRQLTDVAVKALSPGINDPTTAVHALGHISTLLCQFAQRQLGATVLCSDDDVVRLVIRRPDLPQLLDVAIAQPRLYGAEDPLVLERLFAVLRDLAWRADRPEHQEAIRDQLERLRRTVTEQNFEPAKRERLANAGLAVEGALAKSWLPSM